MGIRLVSGKYQEKVLHLYRFIAIPSSFSLKKEQMRIESVEEKKLARRCVKEGLEKNVGILEGITAHFLLIAC